MAKFREYPDDYAILLKLQFANVNYMFRGFFELEKWLILWGYMSHDGHLSDAVALIEWLQFDNLASDEE